MGESNRVDEESLVGCEVCGTDCESRPSGAAHSRLRYLLPVVDHAEAVREARAVFVRHGSRKRPGTTVTEPRWFETNGQEPAGTGQLELGV